MSNVRTWAGEVADYYTPFDLGTTLHSCGSATDLVLEKCIAQRLMSPSLILSGQKGQNRRTTMHTEPSHNYAHQFDMSSFVLQYSISVCP